MDESPTPSKKTKFIPNMEESNQKKAGEEESQTHTHDSILKDPVSNPHVTLPSEGLDVGEDEILHEFSVFCHSPLDAGETKLKIIQYPLRDTSESYDIGKVKWQLEPNVTFIPEQRSSIEIVVMKSGYVPELTLSSKKNQFSAMDVAVGVVNGHELHLHPVDEVMHLIPSDKYDFTKDQPAKSADRIPLKYHGHTSEQSREYLKTLVGKESSSEANFAVMKPHDYLVSLCDGASMNDESKNQKRSTEVEHNIMKMLKSAQVCSFNDFKNLAFEYSKERLVETLEKHAHLVQGHWIAKTSLLISQESVLRLPRDYVLSLFSNDLLVKRNSIDTLTNHLDQHVQFHLKVFGTSLHSGWEFISCPDKKFMEKEFALVQKHKNNLAELKSHVFREVTVLGFRFPLNDLLTGLGVCNYKILQAGLHYLAVAQGHRVRIDHRVYKRYFENVLDVPENELPVELKNVLEELTFNIHGTYVVKSPGVRRSEAYLRFRGVVIEMFLQRPPHSTISKKDLMNETKTRCPEFDDHMLSSLFEIVRDELCLGRANALSLKKGNEKKVYPTRYPAYDGEFLDTYRWD